MLDDKFVREHDEPEDVDGDGLLPIARKVAMGGVCKCLPVAQYPEAESRSRRGLPGVPIVVYMTR